MRVVAIDGPAASGKSSTAAAVAEALGFVHVDSGSLYRAMTWLAIQQQLTDPAAICDLARDSHVQLTFNGGALRLAMAGVEDPELIVREPQVDKSVSAIAAMPLIRDFVNATIRTAAATVAGVVIDGRDIGTVVMPDAQLKVFLTATPAARAERRLRQQGSFAPERLLQEAADLERRDQLDSQRAVAPLRQAADAVLLDTTPLTFGQQVATIVELAHQRGLTSPQ